MPSSDARKIMPEEYYQTHDCYDRRIDGLPKNPERIGWILFTITVIVLYILMSRCL